MLFPLDTSYVVCQLCNVRVDAIEPHLELEHPKFPYAQYVVQFPLAQTKGIPVPPPVTEDVRVSVSAAEAEAHPGGREGALIEKSLDRVERRGYREDVVALRDQGYPASYTVASVAYLMVLARRARVLLEKVREETDGGIFGGEHLEILSDVETRISAVLRDLEKNRQIREEKVDADPLKVLEQEMVEAEEWVRAHQGEFVESCKNCGQVLTPPALPHWAFEPIETARGTEWPVWSRELWGLVWERTIPLWVMAYALRTSPEGLKRIAERRGDPWPEGVVLEAEEVELRKRLDVQDQEALDNVGR